MLMQELDEAQGDVVCLQEVQTDHFEQHLNPMMQERGYEGIFKQKTRESMGKYGKVSEPFSGLGIMGKISKSGNEIKNLIENFASAGLLFN